MEMFCYQCEQTMNNTGCRFETGVCGKNKDTANLQDELVNCLIKLAEYEQNEPKVCSIKCEGGCNTDSAAEIIQEGLFITLTNVNFDNNSILDFIEKVKNKAGEPDFNIQTVFQNENQNIKSLKSLILFGLKGISAYAYHARALGYFNEEVDDFFFEALLAIKNENNEENLTSLVLKTGEINLKCMEMLDLANTQTFGEPVPAVVSTTIEKGPFIVVSGHDFLDLKLLLEQTKDMGINIYTHGEMLPAHGYPELKKYPHLKGNFGTAWQNQQKEFMGIKGAVLFTTNCIMPPKDDYKDKIFTTNVVNFPNCYHIDKNKDFTPLINKALELKGYEENKEFFGVNGGNKLKVGYHRNTVLSVLPKVAELIKEGKISRIFLIGGCDGARAGRNYYSEFAKLTPVDSLILTLACGKYRFNDLDLGEINGIPRILDMGQCNDAYGAITVATTLSKEMGVEINKLPLSFILSWYEQKAVAILLTLFYLNIENIYLGPTLPAFISKDVLDFLVDKFKVKKISTPENDLSEILK